MTTPPPTASACARAELDAYDAYTAALDTYAEALRALTDGQTVPDAGQIQAAEKHTGRAWTEATDATDAALEREGHAPLPDPRHPALVALGFADLARAEIDALRAYREALDWYLCDPTDASDEACDKARAAWDAAIAASNAYRVRHHMNDLPEWRMTALRQSLQEPRR